MKIFIVTCSFNTSQMLIDCAFKNLQEAEAYAAELDADKAKAIVRCKELIALRDSEAMVKFLDEKSGVTFEVVGAEMK